jgi:hypothetical protein
MVAIHELRQSISIIAGELDVVHCQWRHHVVPQIIRLGRQYIKYYKVVASE